MHGQFRRRGSAQSDKYIRADLDAQTLQLLQDPAMVGSKEAIVQIVTHVLRGNFGQVADPTWRLPSFIRSFETYKYQEALAKVSITPLTCKWILDIEQVIRWAGYHQSTMLWLYGEPGAGKSSLACHLVRELEVPPENWARAGRSEVLYSFCHHQKNCTPSGVLSVLIHRLLSRVPELHPIFDRIAHQRMYEPSDIRQGLIPKSKHLAPFKLFLLLEELVDNIHTWRDKIFVVIDGVDALGEDEQKVLMDVFKNVGTLQRDSRVESGKAVLKVFFTSRPSQHASEAQSSYNTQYNNTEFPDRFQTVGTHDLQSHIDGDLEIFIERKMEHFRDIQRHTPEFLNDIEQSLAQSNSKTFLQVSFCFKQLAAADSSMLSASQILDQISEDLATFYRNIFRVLLDRHQQSPVQLPASISNLITLVTYSYESLTIDDLAIASECTGEDWNVDHLQSFTVQEVQIANKRLKATINGLASPILKMSHGSVEFFHPTIRDSILRAGLKPSLVPKASEAHRMLALSCMRVIVRNASVQLPLPANTNSIKQWREKLMKEPLLRYAMRFWEKHLLEAVPHDTPTSGIDVDILKSFKSLMNLWSRPSLEEYISFLLSHIGKVQVSSERQSRARALSPIEILSHLGFDPFLRRYLELPNIRDALNSMQVIGENALLLAARGNHKGHEACFQTLLKAFNITSLADDKFKEIMTDSTKTQQPEILEQVLRLRTVTADEFARALVAAFISGDRKILYELSKVRTMFTTVTNGFGWTPLHAIFAQSAEEEPWHMRRGYSYGAPEDKYRNVREVRHAVAVYLISHNVDINAKDKFGFTALHWACMNRAFCHVKTIDFLVERNANPIARSVTQLTPLHLAAYISDSATAVERLIELSRAYSKPDEDNIVCSFTIGKMTPLHWAVSRRQRGSDADPTANIVETLLRHGGDLHIPNERGLTPLEWGGSSWMRQDVFTRLEGVHAIEIRYAPPLETLWNTVQDGPGWDEWTGFDSSTQRHVTILVEKPSSANTTTMKRLSFSPQWSDNFALGELVLGFGSPKASHSLTTVLEKDRQRRIKDKLAVVLVHPVTEAPQHKPKGFGRGLLPESSRRTVKRQNIRASMNSLATQGHPTQHPLLALDHASFSSTSQNP